MVVWRNPSNFITHNTFRQSCHVRCLNVQFAVDADISCSINLIWLTNLTAKRIFPHLAGNATVAAVNAVWMCFQCPVDDWLVVILHILTASCRCECFMTPINVRLSKINTSRDSLVHLNESVCVCHVILLFTFVSVTALCLYECLMHLHAVFYAQQRKI